MTADTCIDTHKEQRDSAGGGCEWYYGSITSCGQHDTSTFVASEMCCACGKGFSIAPPELYDTCVDVSTDHTDASGDGCEWYMNNVDSCGKHDTSTFVATELCCACNSGNAKYIGGPSGSDVMCIDSSDGLKNTNDMACDSYTDV